MAILWFLLYENIDQILLHNLQGSMHYKIGVTFVHNRHMSVLVVITRQSNPPISQFNSTFNEFTSDWSMFVYNSRVFLNWTILTMHMTCNIKISIIVWWHGALVIKHVWLVISSEALLVSLSKKLYPHCSVLVGLRKTIESDFIHLCELKSLIK